MSYQVLARKWRPKRFSEMVGQQHVLKALENALNQDRLHHAYLFTGTRGVGKTTIARIFAKCINCESGVSAEPCGSCSVCEAIDQGRFMDLIEIDAASHTGVDSIRDLLENTQYTPTQGKFKVYLIDEVHMLSNSAFNALLKTLEEPPAHVKFLLATTDPQKLPVTVLSRCLQFNLKAMSAQQISEHLKVLLEKEMIRFDDEALNLLAIAADGSMRDALSLCDQAIAHGNESLVAAEVRQMLGLVDRAYVFSLLDALLAKDATQLLNEVDNIALDSPSYQSVLAELIACLHKLVVEQVCGADSNNKIKELAQAFTAEELQLYYQIALKGRQDLAMNPDQKQGLEMCLLRMLLFRPEQIVNPQSSNSTPKQSHNTGEGTSTSNASYAAFKQAREKKKPELNKPINEAASPSNQADSSKKHVESSSSTAKQSAALEHAQDAGKFSYKSIPDKWTQIFLNLNLVGSAATVAKNSNLEKIGSRQFKLSYEKKFELLANQQTKQTIQAALSDYFGSELELIFEISEPRQPTPEQLCTALDMEKSRYAEQAMLDDDLVKLLIDEFGAEIQPGSARLIE